MNLLFCYLRKRIFNTEEEEEEEESSGDVATMAVTEFSRASKEEDVAATAELEQGEQQQNDVIFKYSSSHSIVICLWAAMILFFVFGF